MTSLWTVGLALAGTFLFSPVISPVASPFFLIAVMISAWRGGMAAGVLATLLSIAVDFAFFVPSIVSADVQSEEVAQIVVDVIASVIIGTISAGRRKTERDRDALLELEKKSRLAAESANRVKDEFLAAVSHELRTPLTTIKTLTHYLRRKNPTDAEKDEYLADIATECDRQIDLVHNLLDLSRIRAGGIELSLAPTNVEKILRECVKIERIAAESHRHRIAIEIEEGLPPVSADAGALRRALCTMVENSIKYTPDGGHITLRAAVAGGRVEISIEDDGRGIDPRDLPHVFESFYRGHWIAEEGAYTEADEQEVKGIGLGLHLAKILIEGMRGEIRVASRLGSGSRFSIILNT